MRPSVDVSTWVAGWTALAFVVAYGINVVGSVIATAKAREKIPHRILVTGSRGKSGTVRLLHAVLSEWQPTYAKITGTVARELFPDGSEKETTRVGSTSSSEVPLSIRRAAKLGALVGVFECMAITPALIKMIQDSHVRADMVVIPTIRLDHLEEEGLSEFEIGKNIIDAIDGCKVIVSHIDQPALSAYLREYCEERGIELVEIDPSADIPECAGHHPTNVAVALAVADRLGVERSLALRGLAGVSLEPRSTEFARVAFDDGSQMDVIDLGGANDPQSAWEAIKRIGFDHAPVVPILVNRWERPLRSVSFFGGFRGWAPLMGVAGTLRGWMIARESRFSANAGRPGDHSTEYFGLSFRLARNPKALMELIRSKISLPDNRVVVVILENTHNAQIDAFRRSLESQGQLLTIGKEVIGK